jgi:hypothetical protein
MELRLALLPRCREAERKASYKRFARLATVSREPNQLVAANTQDPLERSLHTPRRHAEVLGNVRTLAAAAVEGGDGSLRL